MRVFGKPINSGPEPLEATVLDKIVDERLAVTGLPGVFERENSPAVGCSLEESYAIRAVRACHKKNIYYLLF
jgi:hypothetical protein